MKEDSSVLPVFKIAVFLLILKNSQGDTRQWHEGSRGTYFDYGSPGGSQSSMSRNNDPASLRIAWNRPFKQQNAIKITRHPSGNPKENENDMLPNDKFIFPDLDIVRNRDHETFLPRIGEMPGCNGKTFCETIPSYPTKLVNEVIKSQNFGRVENVDAVDIGYRIGADPTESLCLSTERVVYPQAAKDVDKQWLYVVNHPNYTQGVRIETCTNEGQICNLIDGFAAGYVTTCEQKHIYRQLAAIVEDGSMDHRLFRFPSSCCCHIRFVGSSLRFKIDRSVDSQTTEDDVDTD
ncbi:uncharacterized protein LOC143369825 [Andrena cerasifolii]|uniref:uncharacterized protein LOC143369825 n=1 Tax=Andrena cerasifolii TaxID=2819439 RepID=UPI0040383287